MVTLSVVNRFCCCSLLKQAREEELNDVYDVCFLLCCWPWPLWPEEEGFVGWVRAKNNVEKEQTAPNLPTSPIYHT